MRAEKSSTAILKENPEARAIARKKPASGHEEFPSRKHRDLLQTDKERNCAATRQLLKIFDALLITAD